MKKIYLFFILLFTATLIIAADNKSTACGKMSYGNDTLEDLQINGYGELNGTKITHSLQVNGYLKATNAQIGQMIVNGKVVLENSSVNQPSSVHGYLSAKDTQFLSELTIASESISLDSCSLTSLHIIKNDSWMEQTVLLEGKTKISGTITFDSKNGRVILNKDCEIKDVIGGKVLKK